MIVQKYLLEAPDGRKIFAIVENSFVYRNKFEDKKGEKLMCGCTGKTRETATNLQFINGEIKCPKCGKQMKIISTPQDFHDQKVDYENEKALRQKEARENIHLVFETRSISSGLEYYSLSTRIEPETWKTISHLFRYHNSRRDYDDDEQDTWDGEGLNGWLTTSPEKVEEILNVKQENRLVIREEKAKKSREERNKIKAKRAEIKKKIDDTFKNAEYPKPKSESEMLIVKGKSIEDPAYRPNIYGGGHEWIINDKEIWEIRHNGHDGDNWALNNVATGGAGSIGHKVNYSKELEELIQKYIKTFKTKKGE